MISIEDKLHNESNDYNKHWSYEVKPEKCKDIIEVQIEYNYLGNNCPDEHGSTLDALYEECSKKDSQYCPIE